PSLAPEPAPRGPRNSIGKRRRLAVLASTPRNTGSGMENITRRPKVLVVDDEAVIADTLTKILTMHGFEATALYSGESALEWIETFRPDIVLSDVVMHRVDGVEAAVRIRELHPECRVIL